ncbi:hypothetical protein IFR04_012094 [Cadophora malorum]|uniref:Uncharacterized protein n=1 Tax=Cadophora malorum TaxID=108018 RepID=A0A8H7T898_9HELO|nr:hypothetical protein IFR04_012094 [Cadophora malorum]
MPLSEEVNGKAITEALYAIIDGSSFPDPPIQDRFTTKWSGPLDPRAIAFGVSIGRIKEFKNNRTGETRYDIEQGYLATLAGFNLASDDYHRRRHSKDKEIHTGDDFGQNVKEDDWRDTTRGAKLRVLQDLDHKIQYILSGLHCVRVEIEVDFPVKTLEATRSIVDKAKEWGISIDDVIKDLKKGMKALVIIRKLCKELEDMVRAETDDGWDWAVELDKQVHLHRVVTESWWLRLGRFFWVFMIDMMRPEQKGAKKYLMGFLDDVEKYEASKKTMSRLPAHLRSF